MLRRNAVARSALALALVLAPAAVAQQTIDSSLTFEAHDQPLWAGDAPDFQADVARLPLVPATIQGGGVTNIAGFEFGAEADLGVDISAFLVGSVDDYLTGRLDVDYGVDVRIDAPSEIGAGETVSIGTSYAVRGDSLLAGVADQGSFAVGARAGLRAASSLRACFFGCFVDGSLFDPIDLSTPTLDIFTQGPGDAKRFNVAETFLTGLSGVMSAPNLQTSQNALDGTALTGSGEHVFTNVALDVDTWLGRAVGLVVPLSVDTLSLGPLEFGYAIADVKLRTTAGVSHELRFDPTLKVRLVFSDDTGVVMESVLNVGEQLDFTAPDSLVGGLSVDPTFFLENTVLENETLVGFAQSVDVKLASLRLDIPATCVVDSSLGCVIPWPGVDIDAGPAYMNSFGDSLFAELDAVGVGTCDVAGPLCENFPLFLENGASSSALLEALVELTGFEAIDAPSFLIALVPEPAVALLLGTGLLGLAALSRPRR